MGLVGRRLELDDLLLIGDVSLVAVVLRSTEADVVLADLVLHFLLNRVKLTWFGTLVFRISDVGLSLDALAWS